MGKKDLKDQLEGLFAENIPEPETEKAEEKGQPPPEDILADLLKSEAAFKSTGVESAVAEPDVAALLADELVGAEPAEPEPVLAEPIAAEPIVVEPAEPEPITVEPVAVKPVVAKPVAVKPVEAKPVVAKPVAVEPAEPEPITVEPVAAKPVEAKPVEAKPVAVKPVEAKPVEAKPVVAKPVAVKPVEAKPVVAKPVAVKPVVAKPVAIEPVVAEPIVVEPVKPEPITVEPAVAELVMAELVEVEPVMAKPTVAEPIVAEPVIEAPPPEIAPPITPAWETTIQEQRLRILDVMLRSLSIFGLVLIVFTFLQTAGQPGQLAGNIIYLAAYLVLLGITLARRLNPTIRIAVLIGLAYTVGIVLLRLSGPQGMGDLYLMIAPLLFSILVRQRAGVYSAIASVVIYLVFAIAYHLGVFPPATTDLTQLPVIVDVSVTFAMLVAGTILIQWMFNSYLTNALQETTRSQELLTKRANELTSTNTLLQRRSRQLQVAAQIAQAAATVLDPDDLMQQAVDSIQHQLVLYHVNLFQIDESGERAILKASTGEVGRQMLAQGYSVEVGSASAVGRCTLSGQASVTLDVGEEAIRLDGLLLPKTRSNVTLPLQSRGQVIGALNVQSTEREAFSQEDVSVLQAIADQLAVSIDNARLFAETRGKVKELETIQRAYVREQWDRFIGAREVPLYERTRPNIPPLKGITAAGGFGELGKVIEQAMAQREIVARLDADDGAKRATVIAPLKLRGQVIGVLGLQEIEGERRWTDDEIALIKAVTDQMALAIENARLLEETQRRAEQRRLLADISAQVRASTQVDTILRTAIREMGRALRASDGLIRLEVGDAAGSLQAREGVVGDSENG